MRWPRRRRPVTIWIQPPRIELSWDELSGSQLRAFYAWCATHHIDRDEIAYIEGTNEFWPNGEAVVVRFKDGTYNCIMPGPVGLKRIRIPQVSGVSADTSTDNRPGDTR